MDLHENPLLKQEDYSAGYQENINKLKNHPEMVVLDKLCFEVFATDAGKKLKEIINDRFLVPSLVNRDAKNYRDLVIWADGFKDFGRMLIQHILSHEQRIKAETNK